MSPNRSRTGNNRNGANKTNEYRSYHRPTSSHHERIDRNKEIEVTETLKGMSISQLKEFSHSLDLPNGRKDVMHDQIYDFAMMNNSNYKQFAETFHAFNAKNIRTYKPYPSMNQGNSRELQRERDRKCMPKNNHLNSHVRDKANFQDQSQIEHEQNIYFEGKQLTVAERMAEMGQTCQGPNITFHMAPFFKEKKIIFGPEQYDGIFYNNL